MKRDLKPSEIVIRDEILRRLEEGESLRGICETPGFPARRTVRDWAASVDEGDDFPAQYTRAREIGWEKLADEIMEISDDVSNDTTYTEAGERPNSEWISRSRLRVDTRKWLLSKMLPKVYGDKVAHEVGGVDGKPIQTENVNVLVPLDPVEASRVYLKTMEGRKE